MSLVKNRRGTAIVETDHGILLVETRKGMILLPGGGAKKREPRFEAAVRELREETGLLAFSALSLFEHISYSNAHRVVWIVASGEPRPYDDAVALHYCTPETVKNFKTASPATREILNRFWEYQKEHPQLFTMWRIPNSGISS
ncbi:8-oxo-dGTP pyrophosphatase MutT (NUDIX family) [Desulfomicrobium macestii]|uniref:8-oxo-dGTP pyrophosphatase MutT (NUDIX family) n=1 Tax=Desulfomicrobium macestii TaxID=90731 RepID=A0ABR9H8A6_9BACT|nr:NUDIX domain-containing protein [Desulfomicrobium macestii]MBE1426961.1 8-oxo-dGTP pyrophosphatase MutT (NUDIX family) [Desulfomicrobium macestii]